MFSLAPYSGELVGKHWAEKFATHFDELKMASMVKYVKAYFDLS
jgi:hypothetical protein